MSEKESEKPKDALSDFSLYLALLTTGIMFLLIFDDTSINITSNVLISISIIGFTIELSKLKSDETQNKYFSDISVGISIGVILFWAWVYTAGFQNSALWVKFTFLFFVLTCFFGTYRGVIGLLIFGFKSKSKVLNTEILIQLGGLLIAFLALFFST